MFCVKFPNKVLKKYINNKYANNRTQFYLELILYLILLSLDIFDARQLDIKNNSL